MISLRLAVGGSHDNADNKKVRTTTCTTTQTHRLWIILFSEKFRMFIVFL